jgi:hypothetical protein
VSAANGAAAAAGPTVYEAPSPAMGARMLAILWAEMPSVYGWCLGYASSGMAPNLPRGNARKKSPDQVDPAEVERSMVGGVR